MISRHFLPSSSREKRFLLRSQLVLLLFVIVQNTGTFLGHLALNVLDYRSNMVLVYFVLSVWRDRNGIQKSLSIVRGSLWQFVKEHISEPFWGIYNDIVHNQPLMINNKTALADSSNR